MSGTSGWWRTWRGTTARDVASALIMTAVTVGGSYGEAHPNQPSDMVVNGHPAPHVPAAAFLLVALSGLILAGRRRYPLTVLLVSTGAVTAYTLLGYENGAALLNPAIALFAVALAVSVRQALITAAVVLVVLMGSTAAANPFGPTQGGFFLLPAMITGAVLGGIAISNRRAYVASIQDRARDEARRRVDEERLRIARELHDVVAHTMSTINVQASAAALVLTEQPDIAAQALQAIRTASKNGLRELRAILDVLRQADEADPISPTPGLSQLDTLVAGAVQAGLPVTVTTSGEPAALPAAVDLSAYRIIQESLTNVIRHAGPAAATVSLTYAGSRLLIEVADTGRGPQAGAGQADLDRSPTGHGLIGMRERAAAIGGTLQASSRPEGGFRVCATLPFTAPDEPAALPLAPAGEGTRP
ncbi:MAG TPA: sensor histidine kinase [Streptosporangiaceae bacterium]